VGYGVTELIAKEQEKGAKLEHIVWRLDYDGISFGTLNNNVALHAGDIIWPLHLLVR